MKFNGNSQIFIFYMDMSDQKIIFDLKKYLNVTEKYFIDYISTQLGLPGIKRKFGCGYNGCAYLLEDNLTVMKITSDRNEAEASNKIKIGGELSHISGFHIVQKLPLNKGIFNLEKLQSDRVDNLYVTTRDRIIPLTKAKQKYYSRFAAHFLNSRMSDDQFKNIIQSKREIFGERAHLRFWEILLSQRQSVLNEFDREQIFRGEATGKNVGFKPDGDFVYFDIQGQGIEIEPEVDMNLSDYFK